MIHAVICSFLKLHVIPFGKKELRFISSSYRLSYYFQFLAIILNAVKVLLLVIWCLFTYLLTIRLESIGQPVCLCAVFCAQQVSDEVEWKTVSLSGEFSNVSSLAVKGTLIKYF